MRNFTRAALPAEAATTKSTNAFGKGEFLLVDQGEILAHRRPVPKRGFSHDAEHTQGEAADVRLSIRSDIHAAIGQAQPDFMHARCRKQALGSKLRQAAQNLQTTPRRKKLFAMQGAPGAILGGLPGLDGGEFGGIFREALVFIRGNLFPPGGAGRLRHGGAFGGEAAIVAARRRMR
jgi:hypothetical protein